MEIEKHLSLQIGLVWRIVETQEVAATRDITQSSEEQHRLEELLDTSKPKVPPDCSGLSYLLMTPFRYPPLRYGSRFGSTHERGIFYAAADLQTAFAESAVYLWLFQRGLQELGPLEYIRDQRTAFSVKLASSKALDLCSGVFAQDREKIKAPDSWEFSQRLGSKIREVGAHFFWYPSARFEGGVNAAVISPEAFYTTKPEEQQNWNLRLSTNSCWFGRADLENIEFRRTDFESDGKLLHPAL